MADPEASAPTVYPPLPSDQAAYPPPQEKQPLMQPPQQQPPPYTTPTGPPPQQVPSQTVTVVTQQPVLTQVTFGDSPVTCTASDGAQITTVIEYRNGMLTWLIFALVCFLTGCICFAVIPFCIDATKDVYHIDPRNGNVVGVYKRI